MEKFNLKGYLEENKLLKEEIDFPELEDEFEGAMDAMVVEPEVYLQDIIDASDEAERKAKEAFNTSEIVSDNYYEIMNAVEQGVYSAEEAVKLAKAWAKNKLSGLSENKLLKENKIAQAIRDEAEQEDSKVGAAIFKRYAKKIENASKEDYRKILTSMERELIDTHPDIFDGDDDIVASFMAVNE